MAVKTIVLSCIHCKQPMLLSTILGFAKCVLFGDEVCYEAYLVAKKEKENEKEE